MKPRLAVGFDSFKPKLVPGQIIPQGAKLVFETTSRRRQIVLPIELADLLILCSGNLSMREIIEKMYQRQGAIHFKSIFNAIYRLKQKNFLENGHYLESSQWRSHHSDSYLSVLIRPLMEIYFGQKISNERAHPKMFYFLSMVAITLGLLGLQELSSEVLTTKFLRVNGSYVQGVFYFFGLASILLSIKSFIKTLLLIFLSGKAYNFRLVISLLGVYFKVGNESLLLITSKLYLTILYLALGLSHFVTIFVLYMAFPHSELLGQSVLIASLLTLMEHNPFANNSDFSVYFRILYNDDGLNQLTNYFKERNLFKLINLDVSKKNRQVLVGYGTLSLIWFCVLSSLVWKLVKENHSLIYFSFKSESIYEKLAAACICILVFGSMVSIGRHLLTHVILYLEGQLQRHNRRLLNRFRSLPTVEFSKDQLINAIQDLPLFSYFSEPLLRKIIDGSQVRQFRSKSQIISQGDLGNHLFILLNGSLSVYRQIENKYEVIGEIFPPSIFGEVAVIEEIKRTSTVVANESSTVLEVPATLIRQVSKESQYVREIDDFKKAIMVSQFFYSAPIFRDLSQDLIQLFLSRGKIESFASNEIIFHQGSRSDGFYLLVRGSVGVFIDDRQIKKIRQGGFFGEISAIADIPRTASISALEQTLLLKISREAFWEILSQNIELAMFIESVSEARIQEDIEAIQQGTLPPLSPSSVA